MLKFDDVKPRLKQDLKNINENEIILIQCFKKDRYVSINKNQEGFLVTESGYIHKSEQINDYNECIKYVIKRINFEFPNSKNLWYHFREDRS